MLFVIILVLHALINIFGHHIIDVLQNVSVWWHVFGAAVVVLILVFGPGQAPEPEFVFTERFNNSGFGDGDTGGLRSGSTCCRSASCSPSTRSPASTPARTCRRRPRAPRTAAARGLWQSIFYSAIGGWILLLSFLFAATDVDAINAAGGFVGAIFDERAQPGPRSRPSSSSPRSASSSAA